MSNNRHNSVDSMIGNYTESLRRSRKLSQHQLADILLIDRQEIEKIESGTYPLSVSNLYKICEIFETSINDFYTNALSKDIDIE